MLDAGGGGGGAGTAWSGMTLDDMQKLIQNPNVEKHWELLTGWRRSADLVNEHRAQVQSYRDNLAAVWPPEKSPAAAAYLARLDDLIVNLTETYEAAVANHTAFSTATLSISLAQKDMDEIYREYSNNNQLMAAHNSAEQQQNNGMPSPSPAPSGGEQPPVAPGRQEELRWKAVTLLSGVSTELAQAQVGLRTPTPYAPKFNDEATRPNDGLTFTAPPIPPLTPIPIGSSSSSTTSRRSAVTFPTTSASQPGIAAGQTQPGLVLGGTNTPIGPPPPPVLSPTPATLPGGPGPIGGVGPLPPGSILPNGRSDLLPPRGSSGKGLGLPNDGAIRPANPAGGPRALQPGGMIGGVPGVAPGPPTSVRPGAQRINPIGGVIGASPGQNRLDSRGATADRMGNYGAPYGQTAGRSSSERRETTHWDPDNPWETAEGVVPILTPERQQRIDPGPAIGLR